MTEVLVLTTDAGAVLDPQAQGPGPHFNDMLPLSLPPAPFPVSVQG